MFPFGERFTVDAERTNEDCMKIPLEIKTLIVIEKCW